MSRGERGKEIFGIGASIALGVTGYVTEVAKNVTQTGYGDSEKAVVTPGSFSGPGVEFVCPEGTDRTFSYGGKNGMCVGLPQNRHGVGPGPIIFEEPIVRSR